MLCIALLAAAAATCPALAQETVTSTALTRRADAYDQAIIVYEGEVVGDIMKAGQYAWLNLVDDSAGIGAWMPFEWAARIKFVGRYGVQGDIVRVRGRFHRACAEHGGDLDIHAADIQVIARGRLVPQRVEREKAQLTILLFICLCLAWIYLRLKHK